MSQPTPSPNAAKPDYYPELFTPSDLTGARDVSLSDYPDEDSKLTGKVRWEKETPFLLEKIEFELDLNPKRGDWILDYGCGLGRLAKPLCEKGYHVVGVDISEEFAHEKLSPVLAMYKAEDIQDAFAKAEQLIADGGFGHTGRK